MWEPVPLPYYANGSTVNLPTPAEIRACTNVLDNHRGVGRVLAVNDQVVVKFGSIAEGQALIYLERHVPDVPAPRLYAMYYDEGQVFLVMERVKGVQLEGVWEGLSDGEKDSIVEQLRRIFARLRQVECPWPGFLGGVDGGGVRHGLFVDQRRDEHLLHLGPFSDEAAFVEALTANYRVQVENNGHPDVRARFYERHLGDVLRGHRTVLTHGDLHRRNIIVSEKARSERAGDRSFDVILVDWESAGWLPDFWEYFAASAFFVVDGWADDWCLRVGEVTGM
ncbi:hypothetical protein PRZ48_009852 [Zasmidium cellare]|uniref:Aminoglycoside phosphotransferase domain-containing protein n=1 Tax=Zasmidium cellare TaxID=395010 RepID=A0ABR0ECV8_ZASCE|nr:hypothetical protein PRZ48_009852 [Zasmidium cellare]